MFLSKAGRKRPQWIAAAVALTVAIAGVGTYAATPGTAATKDLRFEVESLVATTSEGSTLGTMPTRDCQGNTCLVLNGSKAGDFVSFKVDVPEKRAYDVKVVLKRHTNRGIVQLAIAGAANGSYDGGFRDHGTPVDMYDAKSSFSTETLAQISLGSAGTKEFKFTAVDKNVASTGYTIGLDAIVLTPVGAAPTTTTVKPTTTTVAPTTTTTTAAPKPVFTHPGIVNSQSQIDFVKSKIAAKQEPWTSSLADAKASRFGSLSYSPAPRETIGCGASSSPNEGCKEETDDAQAAYTHALIYSYTGDKAHANKSIEIMNAWSKTIKGHKFDTSVYVNGKLQAAWAAETWTKAGELIRYGNAGWKTADIAAFEKMLVDVYLPTVKDGWAWANTNWNTSMAEATMNIGVFTNNKALFDAGVNDWRIHVRSSIYLTKDGAKPSLPSTSKIKPADLDKFWNNPTRYANGQAQETCRDMGHVALGLASIFNAAETAHIQGLDLYGQERERLVATTEFNAKFINNPNAAGWPCAQPLKWGGLGYKHTGVIGYNHYVNRLEVSMPETKKMIAANGNTKTMLHVNWETLSHGFPR